MEEVEGDSRALRADITSGEGGVPEFMMAEGGVEGVKKVVAAAESCGGEL